MGRRRCLGCGAMIASGSRCKACRSAIKAVRNAEAPLAREVVRSADRCAICGLPPTEDDPLTFGHLKAVSRGGTAADGHQPEHRSCNSRKGIR